jgi:glycolate oxidase iron-sulfur subunit
METKLSDLLTHCIHCGLCLEACPTFLLTGNELESPRGRIYLVRSASEGKLRWEEDVKPHLDLCLGCRACEPACPSGVKYGEILEIARDKVESQNSVWSKKALLEVTTRPNLLKAQMTASRLLPRKRIPNLMSELIAGSKPEADLPRPQPTHTHPPLDESALPPVIGEVYFLEGCAMSVLYPRVHEASKRLLRRAGYKVRTVDQGCCGALHAHNGHLATARQLAKKLMVQFGDPLPVIVDSAGCGSTMKEYGELVGGDDATAIAFGKRVFDLSEFLLKTDLPRQLSMSQGLDLRIAYHEACHLVHGQRVSSQPKALLKAVPKAVLSDLPEADMCCGSAGIYNVTQPKMARQLLDRKWENIESSRSDVVVTGNPGCHAWIAQANREHGDRTPVLHIAELLEASFIGLDPFRK